MAKPWFSPDFDRSFWLGGRCSDRHIPDLPAKGAGVISSTLQYFLLRLNLRHYTLTFLGNLALDRLHAINPIDNSSTTPLLCWML
jgi:hypothetical protein